MFSERLLVMLSPVDSELQVVFETLKEAGVALPDPAEVGLIEGRKARERYYAFLNQPDGRRPMSIDCGLNIVFLCRLRRLFWRQNGF